METVRQKARFRQAVINYAEIPEWSQGEPKRFDRIKFFHMVAMEF